MLKRSLYLSAIVLGTVLWASPASAQSGKVEYADAMKVLGKCKVDELRAMFTGMPVGAMTVDSATAGSRALNVDPETVRDADGTPILIAAAATDCVEGVRVLLNSGADVKDTDKTGHTALHMAAANSTQSMVALLVDRKSDVNAKTASGDTPLSLAKTNNYKGKTEQRDKIVKYLTGKGAQDKS